jgi:SAM-dependent methyltransferase
MDGRKTSNVVSPTLTRAKDSLNLNAGIWANDEAQAWDLIVPASQTKREANFLTWVFRQLSRREVHDVLDLGCGTGRLAIELSSRGYSVTGIDKFAAMLRRAELNAKEHGVSLRLHQSSLENLDVSDQFDAAYSVFSVFNYILQEEMLRSTLNRLKTLIRPGGLLVLDMANYAAIIDNCKKVITKERKGRGWRVNMRTEHRVEDATMLWHSLETNRLERDGKVKIWREKHTFRMWMYPELREHLLATGFDRPTLFGQMQQGARKATTHAPRLVIVCGRP